MNTSDSRAGSSADNQNPGAEQGFAHLKEDVTEALGGARQQADAQFGQYRDTAADQIEALAKGAKSFVSELEDKDTLGMADYLGDMAQGMSTLAGNLRGKSAEELLHDGAELARNNPALFIAGSIALGLGLSRFLKAGSSPAATLTSADDPAAGSSMPPSGGFGASRPYETSVASHADSDSASSTPSSADDRDHPSDFAAPLTPDSPSYKGEI